MKMFETLESRVEREREDQVEFFQHFNQKSVALIKAFNAHKHLKGVASALEVLTIVNVGSPLSIANDIEENFTLYMPNAKKSQHKTEFKEALGVALDIVLSSLPFYGMDLDREREFDIIRKQKNGVSNR